MMIFIYERPRRSYRTPAARALTTGQQARPVAQVDGAGGMRSRKAGIESREHAGEAGGRHRQAHHGTLEGCLCLGAIAPPGTTFKRINRQLGNLGLELGRRLITQFSSTGTVKQPNQRNRTGGEDKLLGNARSIRNRHARAKQGVCAKRRARLAWAVDPQ